MTDDLAERLNNLAQEHAQRKRAETDQRNNADRLNAFINDHAREEYGSMVRLLKERAEEMNSTNGSLPQFVIGGSYIQLGHVALHFFFDKPIVNKRDNVLDISLRLAPHKSMFGAPPPLLGYKMSAAPSDDFRSIVWVGDLGKLTSAQLVDLMIEKLTRYYFQHGGTSKT